MCSDIEHQDILWQDCTSCNYSLCNPTSDDIIQCCWWASPKIQLQSLVRCNICACKMTCLQTTPGDPAHPACNSFGSTKQLGLGGSNALAQRESLNDEEIPLCTKLSVRFFCPSAYSGRGGGRETCLHAVIVLCKSSQALKDKSRSFALWEQSGLALLEVLHIFLGKDCIPMHWCILPNHSIRPDL